MSFFKKSNPLDDELRRLTKEQRRLNREMTDLEEALQNPPAPVEPEPKKIAADKGAKFPREPLSEKNTSVTVQEKIRDRQTRQARTRVILIVLGLIVLVLIVRACG